MSRTISGACNANNLLPTSPVLPYPSLPPSLTLPWHVQYLLVRVKATKNGSLMWQKLKRKKNERQDQCIVRHHLGQLISHEMINDITTFGDCYFLTWLWNFLLMMCNVSVPSCCVSCFYHLNKKNQTNFQIFSCQWNKPFEPSKLLTKTLKSVKMCHFLKGMVCSRTIFTHKSQCCFLWHDLHQILDFFQIYKKSLPCLLEIVIVKYYISYDEMNNEYKLAFCSTHPKLLMLWWRNFPIWTGVSKHFWQFY